MSDKVSRTIRAHIIEMHSKIGVAHRKTTDVVRDHAERHYRGTPNHYHEGSNTGPSDRPAGWYTGEGAVKR